MLIRGYKSLIRKDHLLVLGPITSNSFKRNVSKTQKPGEELRVCIYGKLRVSLA